MIDLRYLKSCGVSSGAYKKIFSAPRADWRPRTKKLVDQIESRMLDGYTNCLRDYRLWHAIDVAYDVPLHQTTTALVQHIMHRQLNAEDTLKALQQYGLNEESLFLKVPVPGKPLEQGLRPNLPVWFNIFIPIVKAYLMARKAMLFNERNTNPFLPFSPLKQTDQDRIKCEIWTDIMQEATAWYGYRQVLEQSIHQMLKYGICLTFPIEEWHYQAQKRYNPTPQDPDATEEYTIKEGLRYMHPHPSRMYYDLSYPLNTLNTSTGCQFVGHWHIMSFGEVLDNPLYWNRRQIFYGTNWFQVPYAGNYFTEVFKCQLKFPEAVGPNSHLREDRASFYNVTSDRDKAIFVTEHFEYLNPKKWGLANYDYPLWHRFTMAGDNTVIWAEPCAYSPTFFMGYDYDQNAAVTSSMALETMPWQTMLGNILSQIILSAKQNLANVSFYDTNEIDEDDIRKIKNMGEDFYRSFNFIARDSTKMSRVQGLDPRQAVVQVQLPKVNLQELMQLMPLMLSLMQRVLQISSQEVGAAATHQQSKAEVVQTEDSSTNRVVMIGASIDAGCDAWKRQFVDANLAYKDAQFEAQVSSDIPDLEKHIAEMGFEIKHQGEDKTVVSGHKSNISLEQFAASDQGMTQAHDREMAQVIFQVVGTVAGQPDLHKSIGTKNLLRIIEYAARLGGAPKDFTLPTITPDTKDEEVPEKVMQAIQTAQQATLQAVAEKLAKPLAAQTAKEQQEITEMQGILKDLQGIYQVAKANQDKVNVEKQKLQLETQTAAATAQRKDQESQREQARLDAESKARIQRESAEAQAKLALDTVERAHSVALDQREAKARENSGPEQP